MTYQAPELFELGDVEELTFGGTGCWSDHETENGEELQSLVNPPYVARPELFELGKVEDLTFGGSGCWTDHDTMDGEELSDQGIFGPPPVAEE